MEEWKCEKMSKCSPALGDILFDALDREGISVRSTRAVA